MNDMKGPMPEDILGEVAKHLGTRDLKSIGTINRALNNLTAKISDWHAFQEDKKEGDKLLKSIEDICNDLQALQQDRNEIKGAKQASSTENYRKFKGVVERRQAIGA
jgi:hypothetical protein